ncbi:GNAT family N-acetyltransferase [Pseudomonas sp. 1928-m]|uniref:GNAT family N-acetyltransferase n=1 Tax=Pseudomonas sp. 1928-m TaxID=3033804 RepID=UPI0023DEEBB1|nr:GNAT family N-acetyltransferase [Pseudomonas sp. 1928-m]MDF3194414.1 GNAT family N-acetyltransferase [Pseudomonas sp. 1928-m]
MHYRLLPAPLKPLADKFYRSQRSAMRATTGAQLWVAEDRQIVAALCLHQVAHGHWLTSLLVDSARREQGIARQLIETALADCATPVWLFCHPQLSDFYLRLGFAPCTDLPQPLAERLSRYQRTKSLLAFSRISCAGLTAQGLEP